MDVTLNLISKLQSVSTNIPLLEYTFYFFPFFLVPSSSLENDYIERTLYHLLNFSTYDSDIYVSFVTQT